MMELANILRAKSKDEGSYLLVDHVKETIDRASELKKFIGNNKDVIEYEEIINDNFFKDLVIALFLHDLGKINFGFQNKVFKREDKEEDNKDWEQIKEFFGKKYRNIEVKDHEVISTLYSLIFLDNEPNERKIRTAILFHHYNNFYVNREPNIRYIFDDYPDLENYLDFLLEKKDEIEKLLKKMIDILLNEFGDTTFIKETLNDLKEKIQLKKLEGLKEALKRGYGLSTKIEFYEEIFDIDEDEQNKLNENWLNFFVFLGALRRCDYSASGNVEIENVQNLAETAYKELTQNIKKAINKENEEIWQEKLLKEKDPENLILVAPTGSGKTEFALLWAKNRGRKLIYTLPLRVALNDLFWRFKMENNKEGYFNSDLVDILHSTSFIEYLKEEKEGKDVEIDNKVTSTKLFSSPILLTTPDQVFLSSLKYYGFDKLVSVYPTSSIVIDEIQAYNPEMAAVIIKTLKIIKELKGDILIITATFPPYFKEFLNFDTLDIEKLIKENKIKEDKVKNYNLERHRIKTEDFSLFDYDPNLKPNEDGMKELKKLIENNQNKNIMILVNNVGKAINLYKLLVQYYENFKNEEDKEWKKVQEFFKELNLDKDNIFLLHSRLIEKEKSRRIEEIKNKLKSDEKVILVATQIVEASVDVDFDVLITEISPIDSQIQRWGRIYRNRNNHYNEKEPNIIIFTNFEEDRGTIVIYDKKVIGKTKDILQKENLDNRLNYEEERALIEKVFNEKINGVKLNELYINEINKNLEWLNYYSAEKRSEAQRIFRRIAGIQVVVPDLMILSEDEVERAFGEAIKVRENWNLPWESKEGESIIKKVKNKISNGEIKEKTNNWKWKLLEILYSYSFNLPIFSFEKHKYAILEKNNFKEFLILRSKDINVEEIREYGVNNLKNIDIDGEEIGEFGRNIV